MTAFRWEVEAAMPSMDAWIAEWSAANTQWLGGHPLFDAKFVGPLVSHFAPPGLRFARCTVNGAAVGYALLEPRGRGRWSAFLPSQGCISHIFFAPHLDDAQVRASLATLPAALPGFALVLDFPKQDSAFSRLCNLKDRHVHRDTAAITCAVDLVGTFEAYWEARPKRVRQKIRKVERLLAESGVTWSLRTLTKPADVPEAILVHGKLESAGWKGREGTAIRADNEQGRFYADMLTRFAESGGAAAYQLLFDLQPVASLLTVAQGGMRVVLKTAYDESRRDLSPGRFIDYSVMRKLLENPTGESFEMYTNASPVELHWWPKHRPIEHVTVYRSRWLNRLQRWRDKRIRARGTSSVPPMDKANES